MIPVHTSTGDVEWVWTGDMWQSALETDRIKAHDRQYWSKLRWEYDAVAGMDMPMRIEWEDSWILDVV